MKRNKNRDRLFCGFLSLILAAGMTQGCASPHVSDQSNYNSQETVEDQTPSYSYEDNDKTEGGPAPAETNAQSGAGKKKTPEEEKTPEDTSKDKTDQKENSSDSSSKEEKAKKESQEKTSSKEEAATVHSEPSKKEEKKESKPGKTDSVPAYQDSETSDPGSEDWEDYNETEIEEEDTEDREYYDEDSPDEDYDEDSPAEYEYPEEEDASEDMTDDLPGFSDEDAVPEEISSAEGTSAQEEAAPQEAAMGDIQDLLEDTPEEPVYDILSYISSIDSLESLAGQLEMYEAEPRMLAEYPDVKAYEKDSLHIEFSREESRIYISNNGEVLPNIVNVTAGSSLLGEDYNSLSEILEARGWSPEAAEIDPSEAVISASYIQSVNGMDLVFTINFGDDNKIDSWTIDNLQQ